MRITDETVIDLTVPAAQGDGYFGRCPSCGSPGVHGFEFRENWMHCHTHKVKWCVGSGLFSNPNAGPDDDWKGADPDPAYAGYRVIDSSEAVFG